MAPSTHTHTHTHSHTQLILVHVAGVFFSNLSSIIPANLLLASSVPVSLTLVAIEWVEKNDKKSHTAGDRTTTRAKGKNHDECGNATREKTVKLKKYLLAFYVFSFLVSLELRYASFQFVFARHLLRNRSNSCCATMLREKFLI